MLDRDPAHYLRALTTTGTPQRLMWLDCQPATTREGGAFVDRWQRGALGTTHWTSKRGVRRDTMSTFTVAQALWSVAADWCRPGRRVVLFAHDLAYHLRVSQALLHLPAVGFRLDKIVLERTAAWALFRNGKRSLLCCDLKSWAPAWQPPAGDPGARAAAVRDSVLQILAWVEGEGLGPFRPTGSGQSYAAFRRRFLSHRLLVHDDLERLATERAAMWTGRCEAWRHGRLDGGPFTELDMTAAYLTIAGQSEVPAVATRRLRAPAWRRLLDLADEYAILAEVQVTTRRPVVPARVGDHTCWPVGTFDTVIWDPELWLAGRHADRLRVKRAMLYRRAPALRDFAGYVDGVMAGSMNAYGPLPALVAKHWSRCLVGRLGLRYRAWQPLARVDEPALQLVTWLDVEEGQATDVLIAGRQAMILTALSEARDSLPQIPGWVMSECRRRLWQAIDAAGEANVCYVDTDSMILTAAGVRGLRDRLTAADAGLWAVKGRYDRVTVHGPRNLAVESGRRVAGVPLSARQTAPLEFTGQVMRSIKESIRSGELDHVASLPRRFVLDAPDLRRQHLPGGRTEPFTIERRKP
jgi:hypothetical protein